MLARPKLHVNKITLEPQLLTDLAHAFAWFVIEALLTLLAILAVLKSAQNGTHYSQYPISLVPSSSNPKPTLIPTIVSADNSGTLLH